MWGGECVLVWVVWVLGGYCAVGVLGYLCEDGCVYVHGFCCWVKVWFCHSLAFWSMWLVMVWRLFGWVRSTVWVCLVLWFVVICPSCMVSWVSSLLCWWWARLVLWPMVSVKLCGVSPAIPGPSWILQW